MCVSGAFGQTIFLLHLNGPYSKVFVSKYGLERWLSEVREQFKIYEKDVYFEVE